MRILLDAKDNASSVIKNVAKAIGGSGGAGGVGSLLGVIGGVTLAAVAMAAVVGGVSVHAAGDFQQAMLSLVAHAGLAKDQFDKTGASVLAMATDVGRAPTDLAEALYPILSAFSGITNQSQKASLSLATLKMSFEAVAGTTVDGTNVANAAVGTFNALGYGAANVTDKMGKMKNLFDIMDLTVQQGNMQWDAYKNVIAKLAVSIQGTGIKFTEASAALATMTNMGYTAQRAQTYLSNTFTTLAIKTDALAKHAAKLHIPFNESAYASMNLAQKLEYLNQITDGNKQKLLALMGNNSTALKTFNALTTGIQGYKSNLDALNHSQGALAASFATASQGFNFQMSKLGASFQVLFVTIGLQLLPYLTKFVAYITPLVSSFASWLTSSHAVSNGMATLITWIQQGVKWITQIGSQVGAYLLPIFKQVGAFLASINWGAVFKTLWVIIGQVNSFMRSTFLPVWQELVTDFGQVRTAIQPMMPLLQQIAIGIGGVVVVAIILLIATLAGLAKALAAVMIGVIRFVTGAIQFFSGLFQFFQSTMQLIADLLTGRWDKIGVDLDHMMHGLLNMFIGVWNMISGLWSASFGAIQGFAQGFASAIIGIFQHLASIIVGHSIIPDMINSIVNWFLQLPGRAGAAVRSMVSTVVGILNGLVSTMFTIGSNIVQGIASGISAGIGFVTSAIGNVVSTIANMLPHSPAKVGPLRYLDYSGAQIVKQLSQGMERAKPTFQASLNTMLSYPVHPQAGQVAVAGGPSSGGGAVNVSIVINNPIVDSERRMQQMTDDMEQRLARKFMRQNPTFAAGGIH